MFFLYFLCSSASNIAQRKLAKALLKRTFASFLQHEKKNINKDQYIHSFAIHVVHNYNHKTTLFNANLPSNRLNVTQLLFVFFFLLFFCRISFFRQSQEMLFQLINLFYGSDSEDIQFLCYVGTHVPFFRFRSQMIASFNLYVSTSSALAQVFQGI